MSTAKRKRTPKRADQHTQPTEPPPASQPAHPVTELPEAFWKSAAKFQRLR